MSAIVAQLLRAAKAKIATPEKWTTGATARDAQGKAIWIEWPKRVGGSFTRMPAHAATLCAGGAVNAANAEVGNGNEWAWAYAALARAQSRPTESIGIYQDSLSHAETMAWLDRAIAAESEATS